MAISRELSSIGKFWFVEWCPKTDQLHAEEIEMFLASNLDHAKRGGRTKDEWIPIALFKTNDEASKFCEWFNLQYREPRRSHKT